MNHFTCVLTGLYVFVLCIIVLFSFIAENRLVVVVAYNVHVRSYNYNYNEGI